MSVTALEEKREEEILKEDTIVSSKSDADASELLPIQEPKPKKPRKKPACPLPEGWQPTAKHAEQAAENGLSLADESFKFQAHAQANDRRQADWDAAFRLWLTNAKAFGRSPAPPSRVGEMPADRVRRGLEIAEKFRKLEEGEADGFAGLREIANENRLIR